jgi:hypothetical protein
MQEVMSQPHIDKIWNSEALEQDILAQLESKYH